MPPNPSYLIALDVGAARIGLAIASTVAKLPRPVMTLANDAHFMDNLQAIIKDENISAIVVGLPRNLDGAETDQTMAVGTFAAGLEVLGLPLHFQDEALTSAKAEAELDSRGKIYAKGDVDALAATYILEDFLAQQGE